MNLLINIRGGGRGLAVAPSPPVTHCLRQGPAFVVHHQVFHPSCLFEQSSKMFALQFSLHIPMQSSHPKSHFPLFYVMICFLLLRILTIYILDFIPTLSPFASRYNQGDKSHSHLSDIIHTVTQRSHLKRIRILSF